MKSLSKYEQGIVWNLCLEGIKKEKEDLKDIINIADNKSSWHIVDLKIIQIREAQCIIENVNPRVKGKCVIAKEGVSNG